MGSGDAATLIRRSYIAISLFTRHHTRSHSNWFQMGGTQLGKSSRQHSRHRYRSTRHRIEVLALRGPRWRQRVDCSVELTGTDYRLDPADGAEVRLRWCAPKGPCRS